MIDISIFYKQVEIGQDTIKSKWDTLINLSNSQKEKDSYALLRNEELAKHFNMCMSMRKSFKINIPIKNIIHIKRIMLENNFTMSDFKEKYWIDLVCNMKSESDKARVLSFQMLIS